MPPESCTKAMENTKIVDIDLELSGGYGSGKPGCTGYCSKWTYNYGALIMKPALLLIPTIPTANTAIRILNNGE